MHRFLIAAASAAFLVSSVAPAFADDYPACTSRDQDHCRVTRVMNGYGVRKHRSHAARHHHHHHHHDADKK